MTVSEIGKFTLVYSEKIEKLFLKKWCYGGVGVSALAANQKVPGMI